MAEVKAIARTTLAAAIVAAVTLFAAAADATTITVCFTPGQDCTGLIVRNIDGARRELLVQAYSFTSAPIVAAIARAKDRGVTVRVILDKSNDTDRYSGATYLEHHGIKPLIDDSVAIAHNKVLVIDGETIVTGSFNFTKAAQNKNAENVIVITGDAALAKAYRDNWLTRASMSRGMSQ